MGRTAPLALCFVLCACSVRAQVDVVSAFPNLSFSQPVDLQTARDGSNRLFLVERAGRIMVFDNDSGATTKKTFLDITNLVDNDSVEEGLVGLAFHPEYPESAYFYVNYTTDSPNRTKIARFTTSANPDSADENSQFIVMDIERPGSNHNAGALFFGPKDGYLYVTTGDGGLSEDPDNEAQDLTTLLGCILRIDVDHVDAPLNYAIPPGNPYAGNGMGYREEIWAYGFRNPFRVSADVTTGRVWAGEVGEYTYEEVDTIVAGGNYGWSDMEGPSCFDPGCSTAGKILPVWYYTHGCCNKAITGGYVYRGAVMLDWVGKYVCGDYLTGEVWTVELTGGGAVVTPVADTSYRISSFGVDEENHLFLVSYQDGRVYRFLPTVTGASDTPAVPEGRLSQNVPNPFNPETTIDFVSDAPGVVEVTVYDVRGLRVSELAGDLMPAGGHTVTWDGRNDRGMRQASGVYFYALRLDGVVVDVRRMVLLK